MEPIFNSFQVPENQVVQTSSFFGTLRKNFTNMLTRQKNQENESEKEAIKP